MAADGGSKNADNKIGMEKCGIQKADNKK